MRAHWLAPFDAGVTLAAVIFYLRHDRLAEAREALRPVAYDPHGGQTADRAAQALAAVDAGHSDLALAALRGRSPPAS